MSTTSKDRATTSIATARTVTRVRDGYRPGVLRLEDRIALSLARPTLKAAAQADVVVFARSAGAGTLDIQGTSGADTVEIGRSARGFVTLTVDGVVHSGDLRDRSVFDRRLLGLRVDRLTSVRLVGDDPLDTVVLNTMLGSAARPSRVQGQAVTIAAPVNQAGTMRIEANTITVSAAVSADTIMLAAAGLLNIDASGSLTASKSIALKADRLIQTGNIAAPTVSITAGVAIRSGTITAPGGSVNVDFTRNYVATEGAAIDVSAAQGDGGSIRIDGGTSGHLFNSGTLLAKGANAGGAIRISGRDVVWIGGGADASGDVVGGLIHVGGGWQGSDDSMTKARTLQVSPHTSLSADGGTKGGTVVLWSEESTTNEASISATGGVQGGSVEVSSKGALANGGEVKVGPGGKFLLDPKNIVIADNAISGGVPQFELVNPTPNVNDNFGATTMPLSTGKIVVTDPGDDEVATDAGAVYLFNGATGALISTLTGTTASDQVGSNGGVTMLSNGNYLVRSLSWNGNRGAVTWGSGTAGVSGAVTSANSLVGSTANDRVGSGGITALSNGNYVVSSGNWDGNRGAVTWGSGTAGVTGAVSASNSLVGSTANDRVGSGGITALSNGNYVVSSGNWDGNRGAVTWGSGTAGVTGAVSASNSLVGSTANDWVGNGGVTMLLNGSYVVRSLSWNGNRGAVTWGSGTEGVSGSVSSSNSLVGSTANDQVGYSGVMALSNGNYVVSSPYWDNGATGVAGAVTWMNGTNDSSLTGLSGGVISTTNSIVNIGNPLIISDAVNGTYIIRRSTNGGAVYVGLQTPLPGGVTFGANPASPANMSPAFVATPLSAGTATTLQANNDITVSNAIAVNNPSGNGGALTVQAGRSVIFNADVTTDSGNLTVLANASASDGVVDAQRDAGVGGITLATGRTIDAGTGSVTLTSGTAQGLTNNSTAGVTLNGTITAGALTLNSYYTPSGIPKVDLNGSVTTTGAGGISVLSSDKIVFGSGGSLTSQGAGAPVTLYASRIELRNGISTAGGNLTFDVPGGVTDQIGNFTANTGSGAISFSGSWFVRSYSATLTTTATTSVTNGGLVMDGGSVTATAGLSLGSGGPALAGQGSITGSVAVNGTIIPRSYIGGTPSGVVSITSGGLSMTSNSTMYLDGTSTAAFDKVIADGVNLGGSTLNLAFQSFTLNEGQSLTLVENTSANPTAGTFAGLPEGAFLSVNGQMLKISYTGGDGNDVAVTPVSSTLGAFNVSYGGLLYLRGTSNFRAVVTFTNASPVTLTPTAIKISGLPSRVQVVGGTQNGADWYLPWTAGSVAAGGSQGVTLTFRVLSGGAFTYSASAVIG